MRTQRELEACQDTFLTAEQVAPLLQADAHSIRLQAHADPTRLGFPVVVMGRRVKIPRVGMLEFCRRYGIGAE